MATGTTEALTTPLHHPLPKLNFSSEENCLLVHLKTHKKQKQYLFQTDFTGPTAAGSILPEAWNHCYQNAGESYSYNVMIL